MKLITQKQRDKLLSNHKAGGALRPVVKLFNPAGAGTWLLSEMDEHGVAFGLCDLGMGCPELGYISLPELENYRNASFPSLGIERDIHWTPSHTLEEYAERARQNGSITA